MERVRAMRDLGVIFDNKLTFNKHIDAKIAKAFSMLGFLKRICYDFTSLIALNTVYCSLVRSQLESASVVWSPIGVNQITRIESTQKKFVYNS